MNEFHFLRPAWLLALLPALVLLALLWRRHGRASGWQAVVSPALLPYLLLDSARSVRRLPLLLLGLGWLLAVTALAGPAWERQPQPVYRAPLDRVMVLDMSPSMAATDLRPDRLTRARFAISNVLSQTPEGRTALVVFGAEPHVVVPLTDDVATIEALLPALAPDILPAPGDRAGPALRMAGELLQRVGSKGGEVLLLSDGIGDTADSLDAVQDLRAHGARVSVLGVGTASGAPVPAADGGFEAGTDGGVRLARIDAAGLAALADAGGGRYLQLGEGPVSLLLERSVDRAPAHARADRHGLERWVEQGPWLLLPLLLIAASGFRRGWLAVLVVLCIPPPPAQAFEWQDAWLRPDQQASRLLEQGEATAAAERFADPDWRATARYRAGDYAGAAAGFAGADADSHYNRGNALARAGHLQEALAAYDQALQQQPAHADARFNRDLVEQLLQAQQPPPESGDGAESAADGTQAQTGQNSRAGNRAGQQGEAASETKQAGADAGQAQSGQDDRAGGRAGQQGDAPGESALAGDAARQAQSGQDDQADNRAGQPGDAKQAGAEGQAATGPHAGSNEADDNRPAGAAGPAQGAGAKPDETNGDTGRQMQQLDSAERARADVAPAAQTASPSSGNDPDYSAGARRAAGDTPVQTPMSEQELALEQWLRQVPDDPAGLLRRKFMIEHLYRQQGKDTP